MKILNIKNQSHVVMETTIAEKDFKNAVAFNRTSNKLINDKKEVEFVLEVGTKCEAKDYAVTLVSEKDKCLYYTETFDRPISDVQKAKLASVEYKIKEVVKKIKETLKTMEELTKDITEVDFDSASVEVEE